ncbi:hypothetical protein F7O84_09790 [Candidatus Galacturonibacter soehngenii]|uniref:Orn/DAP/Arg decarboxylase 2 C-terminal domain-containing protein n=1 Tax=Candidatus Galacturonatibacter soehngenii TaxID=2307010 RepID=A0A7V7QLB6_9FIRM|nr:hypothetical protein F7O84_09790 [Candidatus Galacturonibacter soehngenii]
MTITCNYCFRKRNEPCDHTYDITGSLCENRDLFAIAKKLPKIEVGDIIIFHDAGDYFQTLDYPIIYQ